MSSSANLFDNLLIYPPNMLIPPLRLYCIYSQEGATPIFETKIWVEGAELTIHIRRLSVGRHGPSERSAADTVLRRPETRAGGRPLDAEHLQYGWRTRRKCERINTNKYENH